MIIGNRTEKSHKKRLTPDEEAALWRRWRWHEDAAARNRLVENWLLLVEATRKRAVPTVPPAIDVEDLEAVGRLALMRAVERWDPYRKPFVKFTSFAITGIRGAMLQHLRNEDWVPRSVRTKEKRLRQIEERCLHAEGQVTQAGMVRHSGLETEAFYQLYREASILQAVSLEEVQSQEDRDALDPLLVGDVLAAQVPGPETEAAKNLAEVRLWQAVKWLPEMERTVFLRYYQDGRTLKQIGKELGRSESRAHQLHTQGLNRLRDYLQSSRDLFVGEGAP